MRSFFDHLYAVVAGLWEVSRPKRKQQNCYRPNKWLQLQIVWFNTKRKVVLR
jgi:hypothetical protein